MLRNPIPLLSSFFDHLPAPTDPTFHPMKGALTTQSLRGMANHGPMHWRGDRNGGLDEPNQQPDGGIFNERVACLKFRPAFESLIGRSAPIPEEDMEAFADFILQVMYPPNPHRPLDNVLTAEQQAGRDFFMNRRGFTGTHTCNDCHHLDP